MEPDSLPVKDGHLGYLRNNQTVSWSGLEPATQKSQVQRPNYYTIELILVYYC